MTAIDMLNAASNASMLLYYNREMTSALTIDQMRSLSEFATSMPKYIAPTWGVFYDDKMSADRIRLLVIFSGKESKLPNKKKLE